LRKWSLPWESLRTFLSKRRSWWKIYKTNSAH
jgi:hypothetical protein